jgi:hypothetical protein
MQSDVNGSRSVAVGYEALRNQAPVGPSNTNNVAVGYNAGRAITTSTNNTLIGNNAGLSVSSIAGGGNTCVGSNAGDLITTGGLNTVVGFNADVLAAGDLNSMVLGNGAVGAGSNTITFGNAAITGFRFGTAALALPNPGINGFFSATTASMQLGHTSATTASTFLGFIRAGVQGGSVAGDGAGGTNYNTTSDYRLKTDILPLSGNLERLAALKPCSFLMNEVRSEGFIAHELQAVVPRAVTGAKDAVDEDGNAVYQSLDQSRLVPLLTAACQELAAQAAAATARAIEAERRLDELEAAVAALQNA